MTHFNSPNNNVNNPQKDITFVGKETPMLRTIFMHFVDYFHSGQDDLVVFGKWAVAYVSFLSVPYFVPDAQEWLKLVSTLFGAITAVAGAAVMLFRLADIIKKKFKKNEDNPS